MNRLTTIYILGLLMMGLVACQEEQKAPVKVLRPVAFQEVGYMNGLSERSFNGVAQTDKVINLSFRSSGIITQFDIELGQVVKKGALLARLDNVQARLAYEQALASLSSSESQMKTAKLSYERTRSLYEKGSASLSDFENAKNAYRNAESGFASSQRSVAIQKEQINYGYLYAPEGGVISDVSAEVGENASPGQPVATLNAGNLTIIELGLPENAINSVSKGMNADISFSAIRDKVFEGEITEVSPAIDPATSTYKVKIKVKDATQEIKSGMAATARFRFEQGKNQALIVPARAVGEDSEGRFVFLIQEQGAEKATVAKHPIKVGALTANGFEVVEGLQQGQKIAVAGLQLLLDGQEVKLQP